MWRYSAKTTPRHKRVTQRRGERWEQRREHIRAAYCHLILQRTVTWTAAHFDIGRRTVAEWTRAALGYPDAEAQGLRQVLQRVAAEDSARGWNARDILARMGLEFLADETATLRDCPKKNLPKPGSKRNARTNRLSSVKRGKGGGGRLPR